MGTFKVQPLVYTIVYEQVDDTLAVSEEVSFFVWHFRGRRYLDLLLDDELYSNGPEDVATPGTTIAKDRRTHAWLGCRKQSELRYGDATVWHLLAQNDMIH